jgi:hypothetical protein
MKNELRTIIFGRKTPNIGERMNWAADSDSLEYMQRHYPAGKIVQVYYPASDPDISALEPIRNPI